MTLIRIGCPETTGALPHAIKQLGASALVSAGALWVTGRGWRGSYFREPGSIMSGIDVALDSAGFTRGRSGYPWTVAQYVRLAGRWPWTWWAQMDLPCEQELAPDRAAVLDRVHRSAVLYVECAELLDIYARPFEVDGGRICTGRKFPPLVPVLQGRRPEDYLLSRDLLQRACGGRLPDLVGVGSVCTRPLRGPEGLLPILEVLDRELPQHVSLHLFGVKGRALQHASGSRILSMDSMAWDARARWAANEQNRPAARTPERINHMRAWYEAQRRAS